jgi:RNA polymerase sigma-70 factor (ECF subfamily)
MCLDALPLQRKQIFLARWRDDKSHDEIAAQFGIHKRTVQKQLARAERFIRSATVGMARLEG